MKAIRKEDVEVHCYTDGKLTGTRLEKNRSIYRRKDGTEYTTSLGDVARSAATGKLFVIRHCKTGKSFSIKDLVEKVKKTGGTVVILP